jgi:multisubunit Na+/H+ antiporter MnhB subunit
MLGVILMMEWIEANKVFSGFAGAVLAGIITLVTFYITNINKDKSKPSQTIKAGNNSNNIQGGNDVNVTIGDKNAGK